MSDLERQLLKSFGSVSLEELEELNFLDRRDVKSLFHCSLLQGLMERLLPYYRILEINGVRDFRYESLYLDTPDLKFYNDHQRGKARRHKVRLRHYLDNGSSFIEIKSKNGKGRSQKTRMALESNLEIPLSIKQLIFENVEINADELAPSLKVSVNRITLVNLEGTEKVTLDYDISFRLDGKVKELDSIVIAELKQKQRNSQSQFIRIQREMGITPGSVSKYCLGMATLNDKVKTNRFKSSILKIEKIKAA